MGRRITIGDVAEEAGVSRQTVSRALNSKGEISDETRARVLAVIQRLGYRPSSIARGLVTQKTLTIGLVVPDIANPFFSEIARGAENVAREAGYSLLLCNTVEDPERELQALVVLEQQRVDGIVLCSSRLPDRQLTEMAGRYPAIVLVNRSIPAAGIASVCVDDTAGALLGMRHLLSLGRRTIGLLAGPAASHSAQARMRGYALALAAAGLHPTVDLTVACTPDLEDGRRAARLLLTQHGDLDALFCYNDLVAVGALQACREFGRRVPQDVAVVGCDDITLSALVTPSLTTVHVSKREIGESAARMLLGQIAGSTAGDTEIVLQPDLVVRASAP